MYKIMNSKVRTEVMQPKDFPCFQGLDFWYPLWVVLCLPYMKGTEVADDPPAWRVKLHLWLEKVPGDGISSCRTEMADFLFIREQHRNPGVCSNNKCIRNWREKQGHFLIYFTLDFVHTDLFQREVFCILQAFTNVTLLAHRGDF